MHLFGKNLDKEVVFVAEIGVNHEGDIDKAIELIHLAKESNADAVKFQSYTPEKFARLNDQDKARVLEAINEKRRLIRAGTGSLSPANIATAAYDVAHVPFKIGASMVGPVAKKQPLGLKKVPRKPREDKKVPLPKVRRRGS